MYFPCGELETYWFLLNWFYLLHVHQVHEVCIFCICTISVNHLVFSLVLTLFFIEFCLRGCTDRQAVALFIANSQKKGFEVYTCYLDTNLIMLASERPFSIVVFDTDVDFGTLASERHFTYLCFDTGVGFCMPIEHCNLVIIQDLYRQYCDIYFLFYSGIIWLQ